MLPIHINQNNFSDTLYKTYKFISFSVLEVIKIAAAKVFLEFLGRRYLQGSTSYTEKEIYSATVLAPVVEEILFRGIIQRGIHLTQRIYYVYDQDDLTEEDLNSQMVFRIHLSALIFAAAHLTNPHSHVAGALVQFTWSYFGGVAYGYLSEKYQTLSIGILFHGLNNFYAVAGSVYPMQAHFCILAVATNKAAAYVIGATTLDQTVGMALTQALHVIVSIPDKWNGKMETESPQLLSS